MQGYSGYTGAGFLNEPGAISGILPSVPLWNDEIPYWLSVNPRRILLVAKISGVYMSMYIGLCLPYGSTGQWQYPLVIGGSNVSGITGLGSVRYSDTSDAMCTCFIPAGGDASSNLVVRDSTGVWIRLFNTHKAIIAPGTSTSHDTAHGVSPYCDVLAGSVGWKNVRKNIDDNYPLRTLRLMRGDTPDVLGYLDGVKHIPGHLLSTEDTLTEGSDDYTIFQDTFRTDLYKFFAVKES